MQEKKYDRSQMLHELGHWMITLAILALFSVLQYSLINLGQSRVITLVLCISVILEFSAIFKFNNLLA